MYRNHSIAVVVPAYNEENLVGDVIRRMPAFVDKVYAVDDGSEDNTWEAIQRAAEDVNTDREQVRLDGGTAGDRVVPIKHTPNQGVGAAIKTGYRRAGKDGLDVAAVIAGDGQMDPQILDRFLDPIVEDRADYTKGNRLLNWDTVEGMTRFRLFGNVLLTFLTKIASGYWQTGDPQNGYTAVRLSVFDKLDLEGLYDEYGFANDLLIKLNAHGKRVTDVQNPARYGEAESSIRYGPFIRNVSILLLTGFLWRLNIKYMVRSFHPLALFYYLGAGSVGVSGIALLLTVVAGFEGSMAVVTPLAGVAFLLFGVFSLLFAMVLDRRQNASLEGQVTV